MTKLGHDEQGMKLLRKARDDSMNFYYDDDGAAELFCPIYPQHRADFERQQKKTLELGTLNLESLKKLVEYTENFVISSEGMDSVEDLPQKEEKKGKTRGGKECKYPESAARLETFHDLMWGWGIYHYTSALFHYHLRDPYTDLETEKADCIKKQKEQLALLEQLVQDAKDLVWKPDSPYNLKGSSLGNVTPDTGAMRYYDELKGVTVYRDNICLRYFAFTSEDEKVTQNPFKEGVKDALTKEKTAIENFLKHLNPSMKE